MLVPTYFTNEEFIVSLRLPNDIHGLRYRQKVDEQSEVSDFDTGILKLCFSVKDNKIFDYVFVLLITLCNKQYDRLRWSTNRKSGNYVNTF